jgi:hypothetical protein
VPHAAHGHCILWSAGPALHPWLILLLLLLVHDAVVYPGPVPVLLVDTAHVVAAPAVSESMDHPPTVGGGVATTAVLFIANCC